MANRNQIDIFNTIKSTPVNRRLFNDVDALRFTINAGYTLKSVANSFIMTPYRNIRPPYVKYNLRDINIAQPVSTEYITKTTDVNLFLRKLVREELSVSDIHAMYSKLVYCDVQGTRPDLQRGIITYQSRSTFDKLDFNPWKYTAQEDFERGSIDWSLALLKAIGLVLSPELKTPHDYIYLQMITLFELFESAGLKISSNVYSKVTLEDGTTVDYVIPVSERMGCLDQVNIYTVAAASIEDRKAMSNYLIGLNAMYRGMTPVHHEFEKAIIPVYGATTQDKEEVYVSSSSNNICKTLLYLFCASIQGVDIYHMTDIFVPNQENENEDDGNESNDDENEQDMNEY